MAMRLYISGPVSGRENRNADMFERAAKALVEAGYNVSVPTRFVDAKMTSKPAITTICLGELLRCDGVAMLPEWRQSKGACLEVAVATACGKDAKPVEAWVVVECSHEQDLHRRADSEA